MNEAVREASITEKRIAVAHVLEERIKADEEITKDNVQSDFDAWVLFQKEMLQFAINVLLEPKKYLSYDEITGIYEERTHEYDVSDIENELDLQREYYAEKFDIDNYPVSETEIENMAYKLRDMLNEDADCSWSDAKTTAVLNVLFKRIASRRNGKFNIGDRVIAEDRDLPENIYGTAATIIKPTLTSNLESPPYCYAVEFDKADSTLHDCNGLCRENHGWYCHVEDLHPVL